MRRLAKYRLSGQRRDVIRNWVVGNGLLSDVPDTHSMSEEEKARVWNIVFEAVDEGISKLRNGKLDIYKSINAMVLYMEKKGSSGTTISGHTHKVVKLYRYLKLPVDAEDLKETVRKVDSVSVTDDRNLTRPEIRRTLIHGNPKQKALVSFLVCTGARLAKLFKSGYVISTSPRIRPSSTSQQEKQRLSGNDSRSSALNALNS